MVKLVSLPWNLRTKKAIYLDLLQILISQIIFQIAVTQLKDHLNILFF